MHRPVQRWGRPVAVGLTCFFLAVFFFLFATILTTPPYSGVVGADRRIYHDAALRWAQGGFWYYPDQIAGPYSIAVGHILYPPVALLWLVPAALLPDLLWWGLPIVVTGVIVWWHRPAEWAWPVIGLCLAQTNSPELIAAGNPVLWIVMFAALGTRWCPGFALVMLKPSLFPVALLGARSRRWWWTAAILASVSIVLLPMDVDYLHVLINARGPLASPLYSFGDLPLLGIPLVAWAAQRRHSRVVVT